MALGQQPRLRLAEAHRASAAALHLAHQEEPQADDEDQRQGREDVAQDCAAGLRVLDLDVDALGLEAAGEIEFHFAEDGEGALAVHRGGDLVALDGRFLDAAGINLRLEFGIRHLPRAARAGRRGHHGDQRDKEEEHDAKQGEVAHIHARGLSVGFDPRR
jgi:hypothetical protein